MSLSCSALSTQTGRSSSDFRQGRVFLPQEMLPGMEARTFCKHSAALSLNPDPSPKRGQSCAEGAHCCCGQPQQQSFKCFPSYLQLPALLSFSDCPGLSTVPRHSLGKRMLDIRVLLLVHQREDLWRKWRRYPRRPVQRGSFPLQVHFQPRTDHKAFTLHLLSTLEDLAKILPE